ncbi:MAG: DUF3576 domain-containing protein [Hydrogenophilaceae bacterium]|jgi:hypothetical protein|nr:DUF3576 domain-containing protein [Hydrogenophilaceae bacterium]
MIRTGRILILATALISPLGACASRGEDKQDGAREERRGGLGIPFLGGGREEETQDPEIGVNSFLWRASLDTLNFMPLASADPFGGVIITDWYTDPERPNERFKATVYILDTRLRADALNVSIFRQERAADGAWADARVSPDTGIQIENAILRRARELRLSTLRD